jgi:hypothetical protein
MNFEERCRTAQLCLPVSPFANELTKLHDEMLAQLKAKREWIELSPDYFVKLDFHFGHLMKNDFVMADIICSAIARFKELNDE